MTFLVWTLSLTSIVAVWVVIARPLLRDRPWMQWFFANPIVEWIEIKFWRKSETIMWARWIQLMGLVHTAAGYGGTIDWTQLSPFVPEKWMPFLPAIPTILNILATITEVQRIDTTKPLAIVELPAVVSPEVAAVVENAEIAKFEAVKEIKKEEVMAQKPPPPAVGSS
jgi:hypothetical protein